MLNNTKANVKTTNQYLRQQNQQLRMVDETKRSLQQTRRYSLMEIVTQLHVLEYLERYLNLGMPSVTFSGNGPYTVFMPWMFAWKELNPDLLTKLNSPTGSWMAHLIDILEYHIADETFIDTGIVTTRQGQDVVITQMIATGNVSRTRFWANGIPVLGNYTTTNGVAFVLSKVLLPAWVDRTLWDVTSSLDGFDTFAAIIVSGDYESILRNTDVGITILAPTNDAFNTMDKGNALSLVLDEEYLKETIHLHFLVGFVDADTNEVVRGPIPSQFFSSSSRRLVTVQGLSLQLTSGPSSVIITGPSNAARIIQYDVLAYNGILHHIDTVLLLS